MAKEKTKTVDIILTRATVIDGDIKRPSKEPITVSEADAKNLLQRKRAVLEGEDSMADDEGGSEGGENAAGPTGGKPEKPAKGKAAKDE